MKISLKRKARLMASMCSKNVSKPVATACVFVDEPGAAEPRSPMSICEQHVAGVCVDLSFSPPASSSSSSMTPSMPMFAGYQLEPSVLADRLAQFQNNDYAATSTRAKDQMETLGDVLSDLLHAWLPDVEQTAHIWIATRLCSKFNVLFGTEMFDSMLCSDHVYTRYVVMYILPRFLLLLHDVCVRSKMHPTKLPKITPESLLKTELIAAVLCNAMSTITSDFRIPYFKTKENKGRHLKIPKRGPNAAASIEFECNLVNIAFECSSIIYRMSACL
jgi:hypothetical protein